MGLLQTLKQLFCPVKKDMFHEGKIKFFDRKKRFGFIISGKNEYFFHAAATRPRDFKLLQEGKAVKFILIQGKKGLQASKISIL